MSGQFQMLQKPSAQQAPSFPSALSRHRLLSRKSSSVGTPGPAVALPIVHETLRAPGQPLDADTKDFMESRFRHKFGDVRVHTGQQASASAESVNAMAYAVGNQVVFGKGRYQPGSAEGRHLLAHELAHVVQQSGAVESPARQIEIGEPGTMAERQAERTARTVSSSPIGQNKQSLDGSGLMLQRAMPDKCPYYEPEYTAVDYFIDEALSSGRSAPYSANELWNAWQDIRDQREEPDGSKCCSMALAAAEHYMYARYAVTHKDHSRMEMKALIWGYGYLKFIVPRTGICPKSPDTQASRDWGYRGADDAANIDLFHENLN